MIRSLTLVLSLTVVALLAGCGAQTPSDAPHATGDAPSAAPGSVVMNIPMTTDSEDARRAMIAGISAGDVGRAIASREHFRKAIEADPEFAFAYLALANSANSLEMFTSNLALAAEKSADASEAEKMLIKSVQLGFANDVEGQVAVDRKLSDLLADSPRARLFLAGSLSEMGKEKEARTVAASALEISPGFAPAHSQLGNSYLFSEPRDFTKAEKHFRKLAELEPGEPQSHDFLGDLYRATGRMEEARAAYGKAAGLEPENGLPLQQRGHVNSFLGNYDEARTDYDSAIAQSEPDAAAGFGTFRAFVSLHEGNPGNAIAELLELAAKVDGMGVASPLGQKINCLTQVAQIAIHTGDSDAARAAIDNGRALRMEQAKTIGDDFLRREQAQVAFLEGHLAARQGDHSTAKAKAQAMIELLAPDPNPRKDEQAHTLMGINALLQGDHAGAITHFQKANPNSPYVWYHRGLAHEGAGDAAAARAEFEKVASYNFNSALFALVRADAMAKTSG